MSKAIVSYLRVSTARQGKSGLGLEAQRSALARFAEAEGLASSPSSSRSKPARARMPRSSPAARRGARRGPQAQVLGHRRQARSPVPRRAFHFRLDGAQGAVRCRRARHRRRSVHASSVRGARRERAVADLTAHPRRIEGRQGSRRCARQSEAATLCGIAPSPARRPRPIASPRTSRRSSVKFKSSGVASHRGIARSLNARGVATARGGEWTAVQVGSILRRVG